jgi:starvation-inducible outer membrane lipoprotein
MIKISNINYNSVSYFLNSGWRLIFIVLLIFILQACTRQPTPVEYKDALTWCDSFEGVKSIEHAQFGQSLVVVCVDGKVITKYLSRVVD